MKLGRSTHIAKTLDQRIWNSPLYLIPAAPVPANADVHSPRTLIAFRHRHRSDEHSKH
jgi:hypothetical protein